MIFVHFWHHFWWPLQFLPCLSVRILFHHCLATLKIWVNHGVGGAAFVALKKKHAPMKTNDILGPKMMGRMEFMYLRPQIWAIFKVSMLNFWGVFSSSNKKHDTHLLPDLFHIPSLGFNCLLASELGNNIPLPSEQQKNVRNVLFRVKQKDENYSKI